MLTEEQIKNLKPSDPVVISTTFICVDIDGDIRFKAPSLNGSSFVHFISPKHVSLPSDSQSTATAQLLRSRDGSTVNSQSKYDPTRLFKEGDWVRIVKHQGRKFNAAPPAFQLGKTYRVSEDENTEHCYVMLQSCDLHYAHPVAFLELVTPVESSEPFYLDEITDEDEDEEQYHCFMIKTRKGEDRIRTYYSNKFETIAQTKAAAEAECKRLNAEWRKEQNND